MSSQARVGVKKEVNTHSHDFGADKRESSLCHHCPPAKEAAFGSPDVVELNERAGMLPVPEPNAVVVGATTEVEHDAENNQAGDGDDLDGRENEFALAVYA